MGSVLAGLLSTRRFLLLWVAMLVSSTGSFLLLVNVAAQLLQGQRSAFLAGAVFAIPWLLPILLNRLVGAVTTPARAGKTVVYSELAAAVCSVATAGLLHQAYLLSLVAILIRGLFEGITKNARAVLVKVGFDGDQLTMASYLFNSSYYLGGALGGVAGQLIATRLSMEWIGVIDAATYVVSSCCYRMLRKDPAFAVEGVPTVGTVRDQRPPDLGAMLAEIKTNSALRSFTVSLIVAVGLFQAIYNCYRTVLPVEYWHSFESVMTVQIAGSLAILAGVIAAVVIGARFGRNPLVCTVIALATMPLPLVLLIWTDRAAGMALYGIFLFGFEIVFTLAMGGIVQNVARATASYVISAINAAGIGLLVVLTLLIGAAADAGVLGFAVSAALIAAILLLLGFYVRGNRTYEPRTRDTHAAGR